MKILFVLLCVFFVNFSIAQKQQQVDTSNNTKLAGHILGSPDGGEVDIKDVLNKIFNPHKKKQQDSALVKAKKYYATILPAAGYSSATHLAVALNSQVSFNTDTAATQKGSSISSSLTYTQLKQFLFPIAADIFSKKNKFNYIIDYRFLKYPTATYGIGARTKESAIDSLNYNYIKLHQSILKKIYKELYAGIGFYYDYFWNIAELSPRPGVITSFQKYTGGASKETASGIAFRVLYDSRINQVNPTNGLFANVIARPNFTFLGSDANWTSLQIDFRKYLHLFGSKNTLALWTYDWFTLGNNKAPYLLLPSTGWDDQYNTGRGYAQGRFRAKDMVYAEAEYRFQITHNGLLGGVVFANIESFSKSVGTQLNVIAPAVGTGLRIKFNKHSDSNLCIDFGFGQNGSYGLYLNLGEVF